jgi:hypothetical protein
MKKVRLLAVGLLMVVGLALLAVSCSGESTSPPSESPAATTPTVSAPKIAHELEGYEDCSSSSCHGEGGIKPYPDDHIGRTNDSCQKCHQPE